MPETLSSLWLENVRRAPDAPAMIQGEGGRVWTRGDLQAAAKRWLGAVPAGVTLARCRVTLAEPNGPDWLAVFLGLLEAGAVVVPLDPAEPAEARRATALAAGAAWLWEEGKLHPLASRRSSARWRCPSSWRTSWL